MQHLSSSGVLIPSARSRHAKHLLSSELRQYRNKDSNQEPSIASSRRQDRKYRSRKRLTE
jgi:hypothetical protein